ncbi:GntR family transcriptional regulator [Jonesiaceae bacterium BS-20]|uniref:GntR family transcriptional regulator n=1 Tax=Jonesiaceae bacterium BS-20 TaxID=3120821 RepID=A0AAU7DUT7_9MICO
MDRAVTSQPGRPGLKRQEIAAQLRAAILAGDYDDGALLPGENELAQQFSVSRGTIRQALKGLAADQLIETQSGVGSFVTFDGQQLNNSGSWGTALAHSGVQLATRILRMEKVIDPELAASVGSASMEFLALDRVRHVVDGAAVSIERSCVPLTPQIATALTTGLIDDSLSATMAAAGLHPSKGEQWISVVPLNVQDAEIVGREQGEMFLHSIRIARDSDGNFVERVVSLLAPERFRLYMNFGA